MLCAYFMRMGYLYDRSAPKKATNLTVNSDLLSEAKLLGLNISAVLERALCYEVGRLKQQSWLEENREAIEAYNEDVERYGVFSDGIRTF